MSILAEVLSTIEVVQLEEINQKVPELTSLVENTKSEVIQYIENVYIKYINRPNENKALLRRASKLNEDVLLLKRSADEVAKTDLPKSSREIKKHSSSLEQVEFTSRYILQLCKINDNLIAFSGLFKIKSYLQCMELITQTKEMHESLSAEEHGEVINILEEIITTKKIFLINELENLVNDNILLLETDNNSCILKIKAQNDEMKEALNALYYYNSVVYPLQKLTKFIWNNIFVPVVDYTVDINAGEQDNFFILSINTINTEKADQYAQVFENLKTVTNFFKSNFNYQLLNDFSTLQYIGRETRDNLSELLIKHCLQNTIPSTTEDLEKYKVVIADTENLEKCLRECKMFTPDTTSILEYASNIDVLFINKKCQEYLQASEAIMKKDLHDMVEVGTPFDLNNPFSESNSHFSHCSVSKSVIELKQLAEKIMQLAVNSSEIASGRLFCTVQNIFQKYGKLVPEYHKKFLQTIPQQVALFYNNCIYLSYELNKWNEVYSLKLAPVLNAGPSIFKNEIFQLEHIAGDTFCTFIDGQIKQINDIMKEAGLSGQSLDKIQPVTEKCIRQCVRQQELLKTVWHKVLSYAVYNKALGQILDSLCIFLNEKIVKFEDIPSECAQQLFEIIKVILTRGPKLFTDPNEISLFVPSWYKLNELSFVLSSSLLDINNRWADAKGPLALQFKPAELRQLIRALFQNTDRRAAMLAKIQD